MQPNPDDILYHYCSVESLYHILKSKLLRLTNIRYMNDSKEFCWIYELCKTAIWNAKYSRRSQQETKLCDLLLQHCDNLALDQTFFPQFYCACFSTKGDSLTQWRAYAADGKGVAIGFNRSWLNSFVNGHVTRLENVEYLDDSDVVLGTFKQELDQAFQELGDASRPLLDDEISLIAHRIEAAWNSRAPFCKNRAFNDEHEVRLVHMPNLIKHRIAATEFYPRNDMVVPYIPLQFDSAANPILRIGLGPRNPIEHNVSALSKFAESIGIRLALDRFYVSKASYGELRRTKTLHVPPGFPCD